MDEFVSKGLFLKWMLLQVARLNLINSNCCIQEVSRYFAQLYFKEQKPVSTAPPPGADF
jgi:hypothetical protein